MPASAFLGVDNLRRRSRHFRLIGILSAALFAPFTAAAATYYVSSSGGDDANPGTASSAPWRTLARVGAAAFAPGDSILFKRADVWNGEGLIVSASGSPEARITYGAYGRGAKPRIDLGAKTGIGILLSGKRYVTVQDFDVRRGEGGVRVLADSAHIELLRIDVTDADRPGIVLKQSSFLLVDGCTVTRAGNNGILMHGSAEEPKVNNCIVQNCIVSDLRSNDGIVIHQNSGGNGAGANFILRNNISYNCPEQGFDITTGSHVLLEDNVTFGNHAGAITIGHIADHVTVRRHLSTNEPTRASSALIIQVPFVTIENSRFLGPDNPNRAKAVSIVNIQTGSQSQPEDVQLLNNVFLWGADRPGNVLRLGNGGHRDAQGNPIPVSIRRLTVKNNIFASRSAAPGGFSFSHHATPLDSPGFVFDHNLYHSPDPAGMRWEADGQAYGLDAWRKAFGQDTHSLEADPRFTDAGIRDLRLQAGSPAIDAGAMVTATSPTDAAGMPVPQGVAPDIGAHEHPVAVRPLPAPVNLSAPPLARTATTAVLLWDRPAGGEEITSYQVFCDGQLAGETTRLSYTARNLTPDRQHRFTVRSRRAPGVSSVESDPVVVVTRPAGPVLNVRERGARGDGVTPDAAAIQQAIADCPAGGTVLLPPGVYLVDHLELKSDLTLELATGATLQFMDRGAGRVPEIIETLPGPDGDVTLTNFSLLTARGARNLTITGGGRINGNGASWWPHRAAGPRPRLFQLVGCSDVLMQGITLEDPPFWNTHVLYTDRAVFSDLTFLKVSTAAGSNGDGLNPDSSRDVLIVGCRFGNQDDSVAIKAGKLSATEPRRQRSCENITIRDCVVDGTLAPGSHPLGFAVGSETCGNIRHVLIRDCEFRNAASVANLKSNRDRRGAVVEDIRVENCVYTNTVFPDEPWNRAPLTVDLFYYRTYGPPDSVAPLTPETPVFRNIRFRNIVIENPLGHFAWLCGLVEQPALDLVLENVTGSARTALHGQNLDGIRLKDVAVRTEAGPPFTWINVRNRTGGPAAPGL